MRRRMIQVFLAILLCAYDAGTKQRCNAERRNLYKQNERAEKQFEPF